MGHKEEVPHRWQDEKPEKDVKKPHPGRLQQVTMSKIVRHAVSTIYRCIQYIPLCTRYIF